MEHETGGVFELEGATSEELEQKSRFCQNRIFMVEKTINVELAAKGFEQCQADPCAFRHVLRGKVVVIIVVYVDDLLAASEQSAVRSAW